MKNCTL